MRISAKTEYACIATLELAERYGSGEPVRVRDIADAHGIPSRFLVQILLQLKAAGLVASTRGAAGGYQLLRPPDEIALDEVVAVIEGRDEAPTSNLQTRSPAAAALLESWRAAHQAQTEVLSSVTFAELLERSQGQAELMYYI